MSWADSAHFDRLREAPKKDEAWLQSLELAADTAGAALQLFESMRRAGDRAVALGLPSSFAGVVEAAAKGLALVVAKPRYSREHEHGQRFGVALDGIVALRDVLVERRDQGFADLIAGATPADLPKNRDPFEVLAYDAKGADGRVYAVVDGVPAVAEPNNGPEEIRKRHRVLKEHANVMIGRFGLVDQLRSWRAEMHASDVAERRALSREPPGPMGSFLADSSRRTLARRNNAPWS